MEENERAQMVVILEQLRVVLGFSKRSAKININAEEYFEAMSIYKYSSSEETSTVCRDRIINSFRKELNLSELPFVPNISEAALRANLDLLFKSIGIKDGLFDTLGMFSNDPVNPNVMALIKVAKSSRTQIKEYEQSTEKGDKTTELLQLSMSDLPTNIISLKLKKLLESYFTQVHELFKLTFERLIELLSIGGSFPTTSLIELELFFRSNGVDFLEIISCSVASSEMVKKIIVDSVTVMINQAEKQKQETI